jgi:hypothetical protein
VAVEVLWFGLQAVLAELVVSAVVEMVRVSQLLMTLEAELLILEAVLVEVEITLCKQRHFTVVLE